MLIFYQLELKDEKKIGKEWIRDGEIAFENTLKSHNYNKTLFDKNRKYMEFNAGVWCMWKTETNSIGKSWMN